METTMTKIPTEVPKRKISFSNTCEKLCLKSEAFGLGAFVSSMDFHGDIGDLIQIDRVLYTDWALYVGDGNVVHIAGFECENEIPTDIAVVKLSGLSDVAGISGVRVNNKTVGAKDRCLDPLSVEKVIANAYSLLDQVVEFNMLTKNSEHYVTEWKYAQGWSDQATVTMHVMKALTTDSNVGHNVLVNSLNAVLNSPGSPIGRSPPNFTSATNHSHTKN